MSTRSRIGILNDDGTVTSIYCHFDGYLEGVGEDLINYYTDKEKVKELIGLGYISTLREEIGEKHPFDYTAGRYSFRSGIKYSKEQMKLWDTWTLAYHRDREEEFNQDTFESLDKYFEDYKKDVFIEFVYIFMNDKWYTAFNGGWEEVDKVIKFMLEEAGE